MDKEISKHITINKEHGVHLRVASDVVGICKKYQSAVTLSCKECLEADACSIISVLQLGVRQGDILTVTANGDDALEAVNEISQYFSEGGGI